MLNNKIPPPLVMLIFGGLMWGSTFVIAPMTVAYTLKLGLAVFIVVLGVIFDILSIYSFRKHKTTVNPLKPESSNSLVVSGTYQLSRNPMYVGMALFLTAWSVYLASPIALLGVVGFVAYITKFQIKPEEQALESLFGSEYSEYKAKVRRWL